MRLSHLLAGVLLVALGGAGVTAGATPVIATDVTSTFEESTPGPEDGSTGGPQDQATEIIETAISTAPGGGGNVVGPGFGFDDFASGLDLGPGAWAVLVLGAAVTAVAGAFLVTGRTRYVNREAVLENGVRGRIFAYLREKVGANLKQITDDLGLTTTNAIWHLRKLEDAGLVRSRRFNGFKIFYPAEGGVEARRQSLSVTALSNRNAKEVLEYVVANPGTHQREIARALGVNHGTVRWHLKKLRSAELLTEMKRGKTSAYYTTDTGRRALDHVSAGGTPVETKSAFPVHDRTTRVPQS